MDMVFLNCWEIKKCERQKGGNKVNVLGECIASREGMGHSCWAVAGTLCSGKNQCEAAQKIEYCTFCEVYEIYNRSRGELGKVIKKIFPTEEEKYYDTMLKFHNDKTLSGLL